MAPVCTPSEGGGATAAITDPSECVTPFYLGSWRILRKSGMPPWCRESWWVTSQPSLMSHRGCMIQNFIGGSGHSHESRVISCEWENRRRLWNMLDALPPGCMYMCRRPAWQTASDSTQTTACLSWGMYVRCTPAPAPRPSLAASSCWGKYGWISSELQPLWLTVTLVTPIFN